MLEHRLARDEGGGIAVDTLHQATPARRQIVDDVGRVQAQSFVIDDVDVGPEARFQQPAILQPEGAAGGGGARPDLAEVLKGLLGFLRETERTVDQSRTFYEAGGWQI